MAIIDKPSDYFNTKLYTGNGSTNKYNRSWFSTRLGLVKSPRSALQKIILCMILLEVQQNLLKQIQLVQKHTGSNGLTSFDSDGFTFGNDQSDGIKFKIHLFHGIG
jgi:hypothetical protein